MDEMRPSTCDSVFGNWDPVHLRRAAPALAMAWFALNGVPCWLPIEPETADLLVESASGLQRIQVKSTTYRRQAGGSYEAAIGKRRTHGPNKNRLLPYTTDEIDHFFILDGDFDFYFIPAREIAGKVCIVLSAWERFRRGNARAIRGDVTFG